MKVTFNLQNKAQKTKKTDVVRRSNSPTFHESFTFKLPASALDVASVVITGMQSVSGGKGQSGVSQCRACPGAKVSPGSASAERVRGQRSVRGQSGVSQCRACPGAKVSLGSASAERVRGQRSVWGQSVQSVSGGKGQSGVSQWDQLEDLSRAFGASWDTRLTVPKAYP